MSKFSDFGQGPKKCPKTAKMTKIRPRPQIFDLGPSNFDPGPQILTPPDQISTRTQILPPEGQKWPKVDHEPSQTSVPDPSPDPCQALSCPLPDPSAVSPDRPGPRPTQNQPQMAQNDQNLIKKGDKSSVKNVKNGPKWPKS